jgi:hypothetical protein
VRATPTGAGGGGAPEPKQKPEGGAAYPSLGWVMLNQLPELSRIVASMP